MLSQRLQGDDRRRGRAAARRRRYPEYIDRAAEKHNAQVAAEAGVNADVVFFDARDGTMVTRFVEGVSMNAGDGFGRDSGAGSGRAGAQAGSQSGKVFRSRFDVFARRGLPGPPAWLADAASRITTIGEGEGGAPAGGLSRCPRARTTTRGLEISSTAGRAHLI